MYNSTEVICATVYGADTHIPELLAWHHALVFASTISLFRPCGYSVRSPSGKGVALPALPQQASMKQTTGQQSISYSECLYPVMSLITETDLATLLQQAIAATGHKPMVWS